jgi:hypothetical protein
MTIEEYNSWIGLLKALEIKKANLAAFESVFKFSPEKFAKDNSLDDSFIKSFQKDRKEIHGKIIAHKKIEFLKKRKVVPEKFFYGGEKLTTRVCVCIKRFRNESPRARNGYDFFESIHYNYIIIYDSFYDKEDAVLFNPTGGSIYSTVNEFNEHFIDIREHKINILLK